jgi:hypothetical protein
MERSRGIEVDAARTERVRLDVDVAVDPGVDPPRRQLEIPARESVLAFHAHGGDHTPRRAHGTRELPIALLRLMKD